MMNRVVAFFRLIRWPNLLFIALTQLLFHYCFLQPVFRRTVFQPVLNDVLLLITTSASVLIAAAGYVINDYFDINIDHINKPDRQVVGRQVTRRWAILWHSLLSFIGVALGFYVGWKAGVWWIGPSTLMCALLLFVYSTTFKKRLLSGNVIIALLTAWTIVLPGLASFYDLYYADGNTVVLRARLLRFTLLYGSFALVISLIREAVKDMEDIRGDAQHGCRTLPIVAGITAAKTYVMVWLVVLIGALVLVQVYAAQLGWWLTVGYTLLFIVVPLLYLGRIFMRAKGVQDYSRSSSVAKLVMLTGILSLLFFKLYI
jgi:4-hydroxybenzoate polyprenyltransferase